MNTTALSEFQQQATLLTLRLRKPLPSSSSLGKEKKGRDKIIN